MQLFVLVLRPLLLWSAAQRDLVRSRLCIFLSDISQGMVLFQAANEGLTYGKQDVMAYHEQLQDTGMPQLPGYSLCEVRMRLFAIGPEVPSFGQRFDHKFDGHQLLFPVLEACLPWGN